MSDSSFPRRPPSAADSEPSGQVLEFPSDPVQPAPSGTWKETGAEPDASGDRLVGQLVVFPRTPTTGKRRAVAKEDTGRHATELPRAVAVPSAAEAPERPPYLASELLRHDWTPPHPLQRSLRFGGAGVAVLGLSVALLTGGTAWVPLLALGLTAAVALAPLRASIRGWAVGGGSAIGLGWLLGTGGDLLQPLLGALCAGALFLRAAHRVSRLAKLLVGVALAGALAGWAATGGVAGMQVHAIEWAPVLLAVAHAAMLVLIVTSGLSFVDPFGTGGAWGFGAAWIATLGVSAFRGDDPVGPAVTGAALAILLALALPQVLSPLSKRLGQSRV